MKYSDFEKHVGARLANSRDAVDFDSLLSSLDLAPKKTRRNWALLWFLIPAIAIGAVSSHYALSGESGDPVAGVVDNKSTPMVTDPLALSQTDNAEDTNAYGRAVDRWPTTDSSNETVATRNNASIQNRFVASTNVEEQSKNRIDNEERGKMLTDNEVSISQAPTAIDQMYKTNKKAEANSLSTNGISIDAQNGGIDVIKNGQIDYIHQRDVRKSTTAGAANLDYVADGKELDANSMSINISTLERRMMSPMSIVEQDEDALFSRMKINCPSFTNAYWRFALVPEVGYFAPMKTLESKTGELSAAYQNRQADERSLEGTNFGLYGMVVRDRLPVYLKAGISYSRITERMDLSYEYTLQDTMVGIISSTVSANGDTITHIYGDVISETVYKGKDRQHSYIHLFDLPVSVGYTSYVGGFDIGIEAGVKINLMTRATGNLLVGSTEYSNLSLNRLFKNRIGLSYFGGVMIGRNFGRFGDFFIAPRFHYYPQDFSNDANPISQRYLSVGLNAGVVYKLK